MAASWPVAVGAGAVAGVVLFLRKRAQEIAEQDNSSSILAHNEFGITPQSDATVSAESLPWDKRGLGRTFELSAHTEMPQ